VAEAGTWRRCSACKKPIDLGATYWVCSVSTCNRKRTGLAFCSVSCWEVHLPGANHREAWALERTAPLSPGEDGTAPAAAESSGPRRRLVRGPTPAPTKAGPPLEVLVVASRLKDYVRAAAGYNTSDGVLEPLSDIIRAACDEAIRNARSEGRRTLLERDVPPVTPK
jgi:hypothetical protein